MKIWTASVAIEISAQCWMASLSNSSLKSFILASVLMLFNLRAKMIYK